MNDHELLRYGIGRTVGATEASSRLAYFHTPSSNGLTFRVRNGKLEVGRPVEITGLWFGGFFRQRLLILYDQTYPMSPQWMNQPAMDTTCPRR